MAKISLALLEPNQWNANEVTGDKYTQLVNDMRDHGQREPITVSPYPVFYEADDYPLDVLADMAERYVICDGEHRYAAAKELGWEELEATVEELTEDQAITRFYRQQATRGTMNALKEAALFNHEVQDNGFTEDQVAEKYNVSRQYVAGRRMLLNVSQTVKELYVKPEEKARELKLKAVEALPPKDEYVKEHTRPWQGEEEAAEQYDEMREEMAEEAREFAPRGALTPGHMRAISSLPEKAQEEIALDIIERGLTVRDVEDRARRVKDEIEAKKKVNEALLSAKRKTCPKCGSLPRTSDFGYKGEGWFVCSECHHTWEYMKTQAEEDAEKKAGQDEETRARVEKMQQGRDNPGFIKHIQPYEELYERVAAWTLTKLGELTGVYSVKVKGLVGGEIMELEYEPQVMSQGADLSYTVTRAEAIDHPGARGAMNIKEKRSFSFHMEPKDYKRTGEKTRINLGWQANASDESREQLRAFLDDVVYTDLDPWDDPENPIEFTLTPVEAKEEPVEDAEPAPDYSPGVMECPNCHKTVPTTPYCINCSQPLMKAKGITEQLFGPEAQEEDPMPVDDPRPMGELCDGCTEECDECPHEDQESDVEPSSFCEKGFTVENALTECKKRMELEEDGEGCDGCRWFIEEETGEEAYMVPAQADDEPDPDERTLEAARKAIDDALGITPVPREEPETAPKKGRVYYSIVVDEFEEGTYARDSLGARFGCSYDTGQGGGGGPIGDRESFKETVQRMARDIWKVSKEMKSYPRPTMKNTVVTVCQAAADEGLITEAEIWHALLTYPIPKEGQA